MPRTPGGLYHKDRMCVGWCAGGERERVRERRRVRERECMYVKERECMCVCVRARARVSVYERERERVPRFLPWLTRKQTFWCSSGGSIPV